MREFNILLGKYEENDKKLFFGPLLKTDVFIDNLDRDIKYNKLLAFLGIFKSISEATRSGWNKEIPLGFTDFTIGKLKNRITILKK